MADIYRRCPASTLWEAGMGGDEPHHQVIIIHFFRVYSQLFSVVVNQQMYYREFNI